MYLHHVTAGALYGNEIRPDKLCKLYYPIGVTTNDSSGILAKVK